MDRPRRPRLLIAAFVALAAAAVPASARPFDDGLAAAVGRLADPSYDVREQATRELIAAGLDKDRIATLLRQEGMAPEQRQRLLAIYRMQVMSIPRGALGISMDFVRAGPDRAGEVRITDLLPGLPAERVLQIDDRIIQVEGLPLTSQQDLITRVQNKRPGDRARLTVRRPRRDASGRYARGPKGEILHDVHEIDVVLGSADLLIDDRTGLPQRGSPVERARAEEARALAVRFGLRPRLVEMREDDSLRFNTVGPEELAALVEQHAAIRAIRTERRLIDDRQLTLSPVLERRWQRQLGLLRKQAQQHELTDLERDYLRAVCGRYESLMGEVADAERP
ncbi:MAG: PDZ domain-containing protein [Planctomycetota bacterium]|jgi:hypothetical protein